VTESTTPNQTIETRESVFNSRTSDYAITGTRREESIRSRQWETHVSPDHPSTESGGGSFSTGTLIMGFAAIVMIVYIVAKRSN